MPLVRFSSVSLDCADPVALANFYATLLEGEVIFSTEAFAAVSVSGVYVSAQKVDGYRPPTWPESMVPAQIHLDFSVDDLDEAEAHAIDAGALRSKAQPNPTKWRVLFDPAGHPFCITTLIPS